MLPTQVPLFGKKAAGRVALIDPADAELVTVHRWYALEWLMPNPGRTRSGPYAAAKARRADGRMTTIYMHTLITGYRRTDHVNGDGLDNRRANLREATASQNRANQGPQRGSTSRFKGVTWDKQTGRWRAQIAWEGTNRHLGRYRTEEEAAGAYDAAAHELHGAFARLNFP